jgi:hypothetical protein
LLVIPSEVEGSGNGTVKAPLAGFFGIAVPDLNEAAGQR